MNAPAISPMWAEPMARGWSCFPIPRGQKASKTKWERWQAEHPDPATVAGWASRASNMAIVTGEISGLLVLDLDSAEAVAEAEALGLPDTIRATTAKGQHVYFRHPGGKIGNRAGIKPGWDIRGDGGYVVGPGSIHPSGAEYSWHNPPGLFDLAEPPQWMLDLLAKPAKSNGIGASNASTDHPYALAALDSECDAIRRAPEGAQEKTVNAAALKIGHYVGGDCINHQTARNRLLSAALVMPSHDPRNPWTIDGLSEKIDRALRDGMAEPKAPPERERFRREHIDPETGEVHEGTASEAEPASASQKGEPVDILGRFDPPELPLGLLPAIIEQWAQANSSDSGCDVAGLAMSAIAVCAAAIPDSVMLKGKRHGQWKESARLWVALLGDPSTRKTPMLNRAQAPVCKIDREMLNEANRQLARWQDNDRQGQKPSSARLRINDATSEAAQEVAKESPEGLLLFQDELSGFFGRIEKYGGKGGAADRSFWLQAYNGGQYAVNRIGRGSFLIDNLSFSMLGGIQLEPIKKILLGATDDGLIQRILPIILRNPGEELDEPEPPINSDYERLIEHLHSLSPPSAFMGARPLEFDDDALQVCRSFVKRYQTSEAVESINKKLAAHLGKYPGLFVRLCLIWHCIENAGQDELPERVSKSVAVRVAEFIDRFLVKHAFAFYTEVVGVSDDGGEIEAAAGYILAHTVAEMTVRDLQRSTGGKRSLDALEAQRVLERLESLGWGAMRQPERANGRPTLQIDPKVHAKFQQQACQERERREAARNAIAELAR